MNKRTPIYFRKARDFALISALEIAVIFADPAFQNIISNE